MKKNKIYLTLFILLVSLASCWVILSDSIYLGHDTLFHLSRIEGYASSLQQGHFFPDVYGAKNDGFGYGSALFYCDFFLLLPSLLYINGISLTHCYAIYILTITILTCISLCYATRQLTTNPYAPYVAITLFLFSNYRITNLYTRGAIGEVTAMMSIPLIIGALAKLLIFHKDSTIALTIGLTGVIFSHNISFALWVIVILIIVGINYKTILNYPNLLKTLVLSPILAIGISACYTFALLEQVNTTNMYLHYYGQTSNLNATAQPFWTLFNPFTMINGHAGYKYNYDQTMNVSLGWLTTLLPLMHLIIKDKRTKATSFIHLITIIGYISLLLSTGIINLNLLPFLRIIQFAFRFLIIALPLLSISASIALCNNFYYPKALITTTITLLIIGVLHQYPYLNATISINSNTSYAQLLDGSIIDPYFGNSTYVRVEVAGGDYLPIGGLNTKQYSKDVIEVATNTPISFKNNHFTITNPGAYLLPKTYYLGYQVCSLNNECQSVSKSEDGRCFVSLMNSGEYYLKYQKTPIHQFGICITLITLILIAIYKGITILRNH